MPMSYEYLLQAKLYLKLNVSKKAAESKQPSVLALLRPVVQFFSQMGGHHGMETADI